MPLEFPVNSIGSTANLSHRLPPSQPGDEQKRLHAFAGEWVGEEQLAPSR